MQKRKLWLAFLIIIMLIQSMLTITVSSEDSSIPPWNKNWLYRQEIILPISTSKPQAKFQPIDLHLEFTSSCWAKNENEHSVRVCCWDGNRWFELESQIYDLEFIDSYHINKCGLIFLVPEIANGEERYFIFYDNNEKTSPNYFDHVNIKDEYYYYEPISGIKLEGDYFIIEEDGFGVYAIGQKGDIINRPLSQVIMTMKPGTKEFDVSSSDNIASLTFGYNVGVNDEDQIASDYFLISKDIYIDGNLMVEFRIVSESSGKEVRTTNIYKYYYCPAENKRICISVKHEMFKEGLIKGQENVDGIYGGLLSYRSRSERIKKMNFGEILPYLHIYGENNQIIEYNMNTNPESKEREWIVPYTDDCDIGEDAWISYDEGEKGKAFGILFSSNKNIVKYGKNERDGIQLKCAEKEYLDILGAEIDYAAVLFSRNSYETGGNHDLSIANDLVVEFDTELFTSPEGGYKDVILESEYFKILAKHRQYAEEDLQNGDKNIYTLTIIPRFTGEMLSFPFLSNVSKINILKVFGELYQDEKLVLESPITRTLFGQSKIKFPKLASGDYIIKVYRKIGNSDKKIIGLESVKIEKDTTILVNCSWQKNILINTKNQDDHRIEGVELTLLKNDKLLLRNITNSNNESIMKINFNLNEPYILKANYKGFTVYNKEISMRKKNVDIALNLYDLSIDVKDELGFNPGVNVRPLLTSSEMDTPIELIPDLIEDGKYKYKNLLPASYRLYISYGRFSDEIYIDLPKDGDTASIKFSAIFNLKTSLFDSRGNILQDTNLNLDIKRDGNIIFQSISQDKDITLPPGKYTINVYSDGKLVGVETVDLTNDKDINIVTKLDSIFPTLITGVILVLIIEIIVLIIFKRITLNTFLKLLAIAIVILSLFQPWWTLYAYNDSPVAERSSEMFVIPQSMIRRTTYEDQIYLEFATIPKIFTDFVGTLLFIIYIGIFLLGISFIPNIFLKRRYFLVLISASIVFLTVVALAFSFGMSKICEISVGSLNGQGPLEVVLPNGEAVIMSSTWGLSTGFYLCIFSALILIATGIIDYLRKKNLLKKLFFKKIV